MNEHIDPVWGISIDELFSDKVICPRTPEPNDGKHTCRVCGKRHDESEMWYDDTNGRWVCLECKEKWYRKCDDCGEWFDKRLHGKMLTDKWFCDDCKDEWCVCVDCGELLKRDDCTRLHDGHYVCDTCRDSYYRQCEDCGGWFHEDDGRCNDDDEWRCDYHADRWDETHGNQSGVMEYHDFPKERYTPHRVDGKDKEERMLFGVELECDDGKFDCNDFTWWTEDRDNLVHFEHDGSLSDEGVECVTMPCSLRYHQSKMDWAGLCSAFTDSGFRSHNTDCCGLHVHINRDSLTPIQIIKMDVFFNRGQEFWSQVGRRRNIYGGSYNTAKKADKCKGKYDQFHEHSDRYQVVNTCNEHTVEIRFCRGTLNPETIVGTIEMFHAVPKFLDTVPIAHIYDTEKNIMAFIDYLADNHERYPHVFPMLRRLIRRNEGYKNKVGAYYGKFCESTNDGENN